MSAGSNWIPVLTSESGLSLTTENWQEVNVDMASYYLDALLLKPGLSVLNTIPNLASYVNWSGPIILNASRLTGNREGIVTLISPYDGSKVRINYAEVIALITHLKPSIAILPPEILKAYPQIWDNWDNEIMPYLSVAHTITDNLPSNYGVYFTVDEHVTDLQEQLGPFSNVSRYIQGALNF